MADVQKHFEEFDREIRLGRFDEEETLREKRDRIRDRLKEKLPEVFESYDEEVPDFYFEDQGSWLSQYSCVKPTVALPGTRSNRKGPPPPVRLV
jgi:hypothetical protein